VKETFPEKQQGYSVGMSFFKTETSAE